MKQSQVFLEGEGDAWYERNKDKPRLPDPVLDAIAACELKPTSVLELGCGTGWRLAKIKKLYNPKYCLGYDPSQKAMDNRVYDNIFRFTALDALQQTRTSFYDTVIFGFCLYLVDREDLMMIAAHTDRILLDGGHIIIHDFLPEAPHRRRYKHKEGIWSYKMDYSQLWLAYPAYKLITVVFGNEQTAVSVLRKDLVNAFPEMEII